MTLELLRADPQAESAPLVANAQLQDNMIARPTEFKNGKVCYKALVKSDILDAPPFWRTETCESNADIDALYITILKMVERKVDSVISHTLNDKPPSWSMLLPKFKALVIQTCHQRALQLKVDLSRCEGDWCLHHLIKISYAKNITYIQKKKKKTLRNAKKTSEK